MKNVNIFIIVFMFVAYVIIGAAIKSNYQKNLKAKNDLYEASQDSLKLVRNQLGQQTATIEVITSENTSLFTKLKIQDKDIYQLQQNIKQYEKKIGNLNTAIIISNSTIVKLQDSVKNLIIAFTSDLDTPNILYPTYYRKINEEWYNGEITMGLNLLEFNIKNRNDYSITIGDEKISMFKRKMYANITNLNPNTETIVMKVYQKEEVKTNTLKVVGITSLLSVIGTLLIF